MRFRLSIRWLILWVAMIGGVLAAVRAVVDLDDAASHYRRERGTESLGFVLSHQLVDGDPIEKVEALLGVAAPEPDPRLRIRVATSARRSPQLFPKGVEDADDFRIYGTRRGGFQVLQFRAGRLINFRPSDFEGMRIHRSNVF